ncbi:hypothetical protein DACRYDRAFT_113521 [Dacryopinax primogenitus]|uniref:non-specific serine/threonine protein kinase n=1 Tax=Dacryopinax primogenitus (strain DJM 731) TaxID=1858805 RepID=M5G9C5_DACPD|nr:uncharacterized protein DACRYDRAFT_113521 [Dacryopinax primogenitus]EJU05384.1 hypothetical protein DACRYDRAFT_113521 [Dacryopinax primogenitus]
MGAFPTKRKAEDILESDRRKMPRNGQIVANVKAVRKLLRACGPPSKVAGTSLSKLDMESLQASNLFLDGGERTGLPIGIFAPVFLELKKSLREMPLQWRPTADIVNHVVQFLSDEMMKYLPPLLGSLTRVVNGDKTAPRIARAFSDESASPPIMLLQIENEIHTLSADPHPQLALTAGKAWASDDAEQVALCSPFPIILLTLVGPRLDLQGIVFVERPIIETLANPLALDRRISSEYVKEVAWWMHCVKRAGDNLDKYYRQLKKGLDISISQYLPAITQVDLRNPTAGTKSATIVYEDWIEPVRDSCPEVRLNKAVFSATLQMVNDRGAYQEQVVVKFCERYGEDVHSFVADQPDCAPKLLAVKKLSPSLCMVVMEKVPDHKQLPTLAFIPERRRKEIENQLLYMQSKLEEQHFVHGDLRCPNILLTREDKVKVVDFEFAREEGSVCYPCDLNMNGAID